MSKPRVHAAFANGTFCSGRTPRPNRVNFRDLAKEPNACKRCLRLANRLLSDYPWIAKREVKARTVAWQGTRRHA